MGFFTEDEDEFNPGNTDWMSLASVVVGAFGALAFFVINTKGKARAEMAAEAERAKEEEARDPPRDFTPAQLRAFDGTTVRTSCPTPRRRRRRRPNAAFPSPPHKEPSCTMAKRREPNAAVVFFIKSFGNMNDGCVFIIGVAWRLRLMPCRL